jgi:NADH dehydrogenase [ubiquinone] 1 alpha subcomplex assembly factor 5
MPLFSTRQLPPSTRRKADAFLLAALQDGLRERQALAQNYSHIITSVNELALVDDAPAVLHAAHHALPANGLFLAAFYGGGTLFELRASLLAAETAVCGGAARRIAPTIDAGTAAQLLQRTGFDLPVVDTETITATYPSARALVGDLRAAGLNGVLAERRPLSRAVWDTAEQYYRMHNGADDGIRIVATFEIVFLSGWKV